MSSDKLVICHVKGTIKYNGFHDYSKAWFSGSLTLKKDPDRNVIRCYMGYKANPNTNQRSFKLTNLIKKVSCPGNYTRVHVELHDQHSTTLIIRDAPPDTLKHLHDCLIKIRDNKMPTSPDYASYKSHSASLLRSPNKAYESPPPKATPKSKSPSTKVTSSASPSPKVAQSSLTKVMPSVTPTPKVTPSVTSAPKVTSKSVSPKPKVKPKSDPRREKENFVPESGKIFTSVKSRHGHGDNKKSDSHEVNRSKSSHFLQRANEKSEESLDVQLQKSTSSFYPKSSENGSRSYGPFSISSVPVKRPPGLLSLSSGPKSKKPRTTAYTWAKSHTASNSSTQPASLQGFSNLGNTCYMNAILQALFNLETFSADIRNEELHRKMPKNENLFKSLSNLLMCRKTECSAEKRRAALRQVKSAISTTAKRFSGYEQHDAHEFLNQVLDQLKEEIIKASKPISGPEHTQENLPSHKQLPNPTSMNFEFEIIHTITCQKCLEQVTKTEQFNDLSVDMPRKYRNSSRPVSLQDALDNFLRKEMIEYKCDECGHKKSEVTHKFAKLPRVLILHLKRYSFNSLAANYKMARDIDIPKFLSLGPHCEEETSPPQPPAFHMTPKKRPHIRSGADLDVPDGTRRRLDLDSSGGKKFTFKKTNRLSDSDDEFQKKPPPSKSRVDMEQYEALQASLKEKQKEEEARREADRQLQKALELSRAASEKEEKLKKAAVISSLSSGYISESQLKNLSEQDMIELAIKQSAAETTGRPPGQNGGEVRTKKSKQDVEVNGLCFTDSYSESENDLTAIKGSDVEKSNPVGNVLEHREMYTEAAETEFLVKDGRPASPRDGEESDGDKDLSVEEFESCDGGTSRGTSPLLVDGADSKLEKNVQTVTVKINDAQTDSNSCFGELDDSVLLENDEFSEQGIVGNDDEIIVVMSEEEDPQSAWMNIKKNNVFTPARSASFHHRRTYSRSENKRREKYLDSPFDRCVSSARKFSSSRSNSFDTVVGLASSRKKEPQDKHMASDSSGFPFNRHVSSARKFKSSTSDGFDTIDGLASSRKKDAEDKHVVSDSSDDELWGSLEQSGKKSYHAGRKTPRRARKSFSLVDRDEVDLTCGDDGNNNKFSRLNEPREASSAPKLTAPDPDWVKSYNQEEEDKQMAAALEKSRKEQGPTMADFDEEDIRKATELSLMEGVNYLLPDIEKDENDNEVELERTEDELKVLQENAEKGSLPYSYQLTSIVCHLGSSSSAGHYVSDVYDIRKKTWFSYDDSRVEKTTEKDVRGSRRKSGYIFFYMNKDAVEELKEFYSSRNEDSGSSKPSSRYSL